MKKIFAVYDRVAQDQVGPLMVFNREQAAIRIFTDGLADKSTTLGQHPDDYVLLALGELNEETAAIIGYLEPGEVVTGRQWLALQEKSTGA